MKTEEIKLTVKQNMIVWCLQNGWELFTSSDSRTVVCGNKRHQFYFSADLFYRLVKLGILFQRIQSPFDYMLTYEARFIKTKPVKKLIPFK